MNATLVPTSRCQRNAVPPVAVGVSGTPFLEAGSSLKKQPEQAYFAPFIFRPNRLRGDVTALKRSQSCYILLTGCFLLSV